ncbi:recombinase family protein [Rhizobium mongolense]|uniref:DNA invertase Pin-like site-specific DNA recombinase n=1 Tax=Rhizobium mongolense TaxID=57676 RepID=A0A7W6WBJ4_9HYPH|nr:recombinase family protein [Rhizobium mongolense]MBB4272332.1 DNA invertase Pin-like site-specific DNA recombinase [Rhizobium mongolense]
MLRYVVYTRVSTEDQGKSGLGLEAQERDIGIFLEKFSGVPYEIIGRFQDIQSGGNNDRPELAKALAMVRKTGAELLVAKLDRLSRKVSFISALMDDPKVKLRVAQMPQADKFQLHIYAALAEQERTFISERTKAALRMAKERGIKLGGMRDATLKRNAAIQARANAEAAKVMKVIQPMTEAGASLSHVARTLDEMGIATSRGGKWTAMQVSRVIERSRV